MALLPYQERVIAERDDLSTRLDGLQAFVGTPAFAALTLDDRMLLLEQSVHMTSYLKVLTKRIERFAQC